MYLSITTLIDVSGNRECFFTVRKCASANGGDAGEELSCSRSALEVLRGGARRFLSSIRFYRVWPGELSFVLPLYAYIFWKLALSVTIFCLSRGNDNGLFL